MITRIKTIIKMPKEGALQDGVVGLGTPDELDDSIDHEMFIMGIFKEAIWLEMGSPTVMTITIQPGDSLDED